MKKEKYFSLEELEINQRVKSGEIRPVRIPRLKNMSDILKFQLCSEIIRYKKDNDLTQNDIAEMMKVNKSEVSKIFSYQLEEFSSDRLLGMIELLIQVGADIQWESLFNEVKNKISSLNKNKKRYQIPF